ncbi:MAG TPA: hypothetical protein VGQ57_15355 [Polyangiaceae bacterium]|jgi:hypothetical protein|nr:hypothetical protein [Polyangiaceae bacterium]
MSYGKCPYPLAVQTYIFPKSEFELSEALDWMVKNRVQGRPLELNESGSSWRARMHGPDDFVDGSFRTIRLGRGQSRVSAVVGCPRDYLRQRILGRRADRKAGTLRAEPAPKVYRLEQQPARRAKRKAELSERRAAAALAARTERPRKKRGWAPIASGEQSVIAELARRLGKRPPKRQMTLSEYARSQGLEVLGDSLERRRKRRSARRRR